MSDHVMTKVDGNVLAGILSELFGQDPTMLQVTCGACGADAALAALYVELDDTMAIALCRQCRHTLLTVMYGDGRVRLRMDGVSQIATP